MGTSLPDIPNITMPQEDEALQEALADLDRKLTAYAAAVHDADAQLRQIAHPSQAPAEDQPETAPQEAVPPAAASVRVPPQRLRDVAAQPPAPKKQTPAEPAAATPEEPAAAPVAP